MITPDSRVPFVITTTPRDAAIEILTNSYTAYRVPDEMAELIRTARSEALEILDGPPILSCQRIINGHLYGYNVPSKAKRLFRAFCAQKDEQPWPNPSFQRASVKVAESLHDLLVSCTHQIQNETSISDKRPRKRSRNESRIPSNMLDSRNCPLDYFLYHNLNPDAVNCSQHKDRGMLICVCLSNVPGLEVRPKASTEWVCPETMIHNFNLYHEKEPVSGLVCIMAGDQLTEVVDQKVACVHRVRNNLKRARLSISYELRL